MGPCSCGHRGAEILSHSRPCIRVCPYSLLYEVTDRGGLKILHPDASGAPDLDYQGPSCALDEADAGEHTLEEVAVVLNISRERVRQLEDAGLENALVAASRLLTGWEDPC